MAMFDPEPVAPEPGPIVRPRAPQPPRRNLASTLVLGLAAVVAVGGLAFAAGRLTAPAAVAATGLNGTGARGNGEFPGAGALGGGTGGAGTNGTAGFRGAGGFGLRGTVTAVASDHLTVQLTNGSTIDIPISSSTTYHQETAGAASDVQVGKQVQVQLSRPAGATASPGAAASPGASGVARLGTASDVTVLGQ